MLAMSTCPSVFRAFSSARPILWFRIIGNQMQLLVFELVPVTATPAMGISSTGIPRE